MTNYQTRIAQISNRKASNRSALIKSTKWLDYVLEAACPVSSGITKQLVEQSNQLEAQLSKLYRTQDISVDFILTGSVAYNTHISENETIDLMIVFNGFNQQDGNADCETIHFQEIIALRNYTTKILKSLYPEANIDDSQPLALEMSTKSMSNYAFRLLFGHRLYTNSSASGLNSLASPIAILNNNSLNFEACDPGKALFKIDKKDQASRGNIRLLTRLLKNLITDSDSALKLSGYEITSIVYSLEEVTLYKPSDQILFLLLECNLFLKRLIEDPFTRRLVRSPEGNQVFYSGNETKTLTKLLNLKTELENLLKHLVLEIDLYTKIPLKTAN